MPKVRVLPENVANKIAAGEVIERPASVVKELMENSIDAGAKHVRVEIMGGGRAKIVVLDDGCGMTREDALLALERHATSKITSAEDLDRIDSLGFRGEALPSIAAVSRFELVTRPEDAEEGTRILVTGGVLRDARQAGAPVGTRITVRNLYFNTPARAKFLRTAPTEFARILETFQRHAAAKPEVDFTLVHNGREVLRLPAGEEIDERSSFSKRIGSIWGKEYAEAGVQVDFADLGLRVYGLAGSPAATRSDRKYFFFYINGRPVANFTLSNAVASVYEGKIMKHRHPVVAICVECDPATVDINVHPAKREVRFRDPSRVHDVVRRAIADALEKGLREVVFPRWEKPEVGPMLGVPPRREAQREDFPEPFVVVTGEKPLESDAEAVSLPQRGAEDLTPAEAAPVSGEPGAEVESPVPLFEEVTDVSAGSTQLFGTYLLIPDKDRVLFVDQHALHERVLFDELRKVMAEGGDAGYQRLLIPLTIELPPHLATVAAENGDLFGQLGIRLEPFGENTLLVSEIYHLMEPAKVPEFVRQVAEDLASEAVHGDPRDRLEEWLYLATTACHAAVKGGDALSAEEQKALLNQIQGLSAPYTCPHGRPIVLSLTRDQLEKSFKRK